ncbi:MAG: helix-turn-helix transcriptional regulator [Betaproteobacteria bacterium]
MSNIGVLLKQEITRLSRKEVRTELQATRKASAQYRRSIASLKAQVATLGRQVAVLQRRGPAAKAIANTEVETGPKMRFVAKGFKSQRARLGLSAADLGAMIGVTAQSIYNWEQGNARPRAEQLKKIAALRNLGKREVADILEQMAAKEAPKARKRPPSRRASLRKPAESAS